VDICTRARNLALDDPSGLFCRILRGGQAHDVSYGDLFDAARNHAAAYRERGVDRGDVILIILRHGPELFPSFLGAMLIGALPSFLPFLTSKQQPDLYWKAHTALFDRIGAKLLVTWRDNLASMQQAMPELAIPVHLVDDPLSARDLSGLESVEHSGPAFLQHSSGTTGLKKGVIITHEALVAQIEAYAAALEFRANDRIASWLPLYHDMGLITAFMLPLMQGTPVVAMDPFEWVLDPMSLFDAIEQHRCSFAWLPNFAFHHLCNTAPPGKRWNLAGVRAFIDCSEPCKPETLELFAGNFGAMGAGRDKLQACYALAENVFAVAQTPIGVPVPMLRADRHTFLREQRIAPVAERGDAIEFLSCGYAIDGVEIRIRNAEGNVMGDRQVGEITLSGTSLFGGYLRNPEETSARLAEGWYRTRDLGFLEQGALYVTGRMDDLLIVHGINYYAHDIEFAVNQVPGVIAGRCVAVGEFRPDAGSVEVVVLAEVAAGESQSHPAIRRATKIKVLSATGLLVQQVGIVPPGWLAKTTSGKISRADNLQRFRELETAATEAL
jgi:fatty-acyl-CoA synthase